MKYFSEALNKVFDSVEELENAEKQYNSDKEQCTKILADYEEAVKFCQTCDDKIKAVKIKYRKLKNEIATEANEQIKKAEEKERKEIHELYELSQKKYDKAAAAYLDFIFH